MKKKGDKPFSGFISEFMRLIGMINFIIIY